MELTSKLLTELQRRLKVGNRRGVHLNGIPGSSRYKFDLSRLAHIDNKLPREFIDSLLSEASLKFRISWKNNVPDLNSLFEEDQAQLVRITKSFENLINQTDAIESEKGINTFGFGFPLLIRRDQADNKLTVSPVLIWSLRVRRTREFNTWEISRNEEDPVYVNEVLINHMAGDAHIEIPQVPNELLDDGFLNRDAFVEICANLLESINTQTNDGVRSDIAAKLKSPVEIKDKKYYESLPVTSNSAFLEFGGLFSIFEVQKQNIIDDYDELLALGDADIDLGDLQNSIFQSLSSVETDPSQQGILNALSSKRNVLIQGPPGTGKSQSLTAVLINALENNLRTIVVCEKRTALEVLKEALDSKGLHFQSVLIKDIVKDRKTVVDSVRDRVDNSAYRSYRYTYSKESLDELIAELSALILSINGKHKKLDESILAEHNWTDVVGLLLKELRAEQVAKLELQQRDFAFDLSEMNELVGILQRGEKLYRAYEPFRKLSFLNPVRMTGDNPYLVEQTIQKDYQDYSTAKLNFDSLTTDYRTLYTARRKAEFDQQLVAVEELRRLAHNVALFEQQIEGFRADMNRSERIAIESELASVEQLLDVLSQRLSLVMADPDFINERKTSGLLFRISSLFSGKGKRIEQQREEIRGMFSDLNTKLKSGLYLKGFVFSGALNADIAAVPGLKQAIIDVASKKDDFIEKYYQTINLLEKIPGKYSGEQIDLLRNSIDIIAGKLPYAKDHREVGKQLKVHVSEVLNSCKDLAVKCGWSEALDFLESIDAIKLKEALQVSIEQEFSSLNLLSVELDRYGFGIAEKMSLLVKELNQRISADAWIRDTLRTDNNQSFLNDLVRIIGQKNEYFDHQQDPFTLEFNWYRFFNSLSPLNRALVTALRSHQDWRRTFLVFYLNALLVNKGTGELPVSDSEHGEFGEKMKGYEKEQLKYINQYWYSKQIDATRNFERSNPDLSVENLYNKRSSNRFKRLSLRSIVQYDKDLFTTFFPIILTTPDVASNLFKGNNGYFDIVMFDEASQLRLEDNLPAILKGRQIIVAGDEHQMPPSNFFSKVFDGSIEDEEELEDEVKPVLDKDNMLLSCESLLDFATELNFEKKYLDFHYRSRHPFLIDFSNHAFYNQRLKPLPNSFDYIPIKYIQVGGTFSDHTNEQEADMVLSILEHNIKRLPDGKYPSVGIATFNITQRNLIKSKILERQKFSRFQEFNDKIFELEENGLFVKNLENIQGDERDIIILSTTYGVNKDRKFKQVFGPVNHSSGYKLLNVIVTRAKYKIYVCSSIPEEVFLNYRDHLVTEGANNKKAVFYAYLAYAKAISESDMELKKAVFAALLENTNAGRKLDNRHDLLESPFEEEVYDVLLDHFDEENLLPQFQFAGFRLDIVYDSGILGVPKIAIECDGARYHSSQEAYLHDIYRQRIIENHGFVFHRIWSTNWWRNPKRETVNLVNFIKSVEKTEVGTVSASESMSDIFSHEVNFVAVEKNAGSSGNYLLDEEEIFEPQNPPDAYPSNPIMLNSKARIKYLNSDKDLLIQITAGKGDLNVEGGIQKINHESPLGRALLGTSVGDIIKIGNLDNYVEVTEVI